MSKRILIADDSRVAAHLLGEIVESVEGCEVVGPARTGEEAIEFYEKYQPDLVTMDLSMPGMDGASAIPHILTRSPGCIVVVVSALGYSDRISESLEAGALKFFTKPLDYENLKRQCIELIIKHA